MEIKAGDIFCTRNPMMLGRLINFVQKVQSKDNASEFSHAGTFIKGGDIKEAESFEALWTNKRQSFYKAYKGKRVLIGRHKDMTPEKFKKGWGGVKNREGEWYAGHRLLFFFIPVVAKYVCLGLGVCSELVMKFLCKAGLEKAWKGWNPDDIADMIHNYKNYEVIFEGVLE